MDVRTARQQLFQLENIRTDPQSRHVLWEQGNTWAEQFTQLVEVTEQADQYYCALIDQAASDDDRRTRSEQRFRAARYEEDWNKGFSEKLIQGRARLQAARLRNQLMLTELEQHQNLFQQYWSDRRVVLCQIALEHMEYRRALGRLSNADWQASWAALLGAYRHQNQVYEQTSGKPLPGNFFSPRLAWYHRLRAIQKEIRQKRRNSRVDQELLRQHAIIIDQQIAQLSPARSFGIFIGGMAAVVAAIVLFAMVSNIARNTTTNPPSANAHAATPTAKTIAAIVQPAPGAPDADTLNAQGVALLTQGRYDEALTLFTQASAADPNKHLPHTNSGFCLYELGRRAEAIAEWRTAIQLFDAGQDAHAGLGMALFQAGDREGGLREYQRAIELGGNYLDADWMRRERQWSNRAIVDSQPLRDALHQ